MSRSPRRRTLSARRQTTNTIPYGSRPPLRKHETSNSGNNSGALVIPSPCTPAGYTRPSIASCNIFSVLAFWPAQGQAGTRVTIAFELPTSYSLGNSIRLKFMVGERPCRTKHDHTNPPTLSVIMPPVPRDANVVNGEYKPRLRLVAVKGNAEDEIDEVDFGTFTYWVNNHGASLVRSNTYAFENQYQQVPGWSIAQPTHSPDAGPSLAYLPDAYYESLPSLAPTPLCLTRQHSMSGVSDASSLFKVKVENESPPVQSLSPSSLFADAKVGEGHYRADSSLSSSSPTPCTEEPSSEKPESIILEGDLEGMTKYWSQKEIADGRRLVQFFWERHGPVLKITFKPLPSEDYGNGEQFCVSCIFHEEFDECYITSSDIIRILRLCVNAELDVDEKNRVRRNLETFKPWVVSKTNQTHDFFRRIMDYPEPKPRQIKKDLKMFPWGSLARALGKVISSKYAKFQFIETKIEETPPSVERVILPELVQPEARLPDSMNTTGLRSDSSNQSLASLNYTNAVATAMENSHHTEVESQPQYLVAQNENIIRYFPTLFEPPTEERVESDFESDMAQYLDETILYRWSEVDQSGTPLSHSSSFSEVSSALIPEDTDNFSHTIKHEQY